MTNIKMIRGCISRKVHHYSTIKLVYHHTKNRSIVRTDWAGTDSDMYDADDGNNSDDGSKLSKDENNNHIENNDSQNTTTIFFPLV